MGLSRWNGTTAAYEPVKLSRYRATAAGPDVEPKHAYIWENGVYREVWSQTSPLVPYSWSTETSRTLGQATWTTLVSHTVVGEGVADISGTWRFGSTPVYTPSHLRAVRIMLNGQEIGYQDHGGSKVMAQEWVSSGYVPDVTLADGDTVAFEAYADATNTSLRTLTYSTFVITPQ